MSNRCGRFGLLCLIATSCFFTATGAADRFRLAIPGQLGQSSEAFIDDRELTIVDAAGKRFRYVREPRHDSRDREYRAYYSPGVRQYVRWPVRGRGAMHIGTPTGIDVQWRPSRMQIERSVASTPFLSKGPGAADSGGRGETVDDARMNELGAQLDAKGNIVLVGLDDQGKLHFYRTNGESWGRVETRLVDRLMPTAAIAVTYDRDNDLPRVYSINRDGELLEIVNGERSRVLSRRGDPRLSHLAGIAVLDRTRASQSLVMLDVKGRVWEYNPIRRTYVAVESRPDQFGLASRLAVADSNIFLIDRGGNLVTYRTDADRWSTAQRVATDMLPGGELSATSISSRDGHTSLLVASTDSSGTLRLFQGDMDRGWSEEVIDRTSLGAGVPVALAMSDDSLLVSAVGTDGNWRSWTRSMADRSWSTRLVSAGFSHRSPVVLLDDGRRAFAVDRTGRIVGSHWRDRSWHSVVFSPRWSYTPRLVSREVVPNAAIGSARINLLNGGREDIVVRLLDRVSGLAPQEIPIAAGSSKPVSIQRDPGATLVETFLVPGPRGEWVEQVHRYPVPASSGYDVVVYADRVTSVYFDRTQNRSSRPDEIQKSLVSLGAFSLPPGDLLLAGQNIDAFREATSRRNPGAASLLESLP